MQKLAHRRAKLKTFLVSSIFLSFCSFIYLLSPVYCHTISGSMLRLLPFQPLPIFNHLLLLLRPFYTFPRSLMIHVSMYVYIPHLNASTILPGRTLPHILLLASFVRPQHFLMKLKTLHQFFVFTDFFFVSSFSYFTPLLFAIEA